MGKVLVYSRTTGYRHDSIPAGQQALVELGFDTLATEDPAVFDAGLGEYDAVVFLNTSGDVFDTDSQRRALESYVRGGGAFVGVHCASCTEYGWPFYGELVGAWFDWHPPVQPGAVTVVDPTHPATVDLPAVWERVDEWYHFRGRPEHVRVLLSMGPDRPLAWCHENLGGPSFYTALGHTVESYVEPLFRAHLLGGVRYAISASAASSRSTSD